MTDLQTFLRHSMGKPFAWGERDCALWSASWIAARRGADPAAELRGRYRTALGCARLLKRRGGLEAVCRDLAARAGLIETAMPQPGDVGLIETPLGLALTIRTERGWAWKSEKGIAVVAAPHIVAWSI